MSDISYTPPASCNMYSFLFIWFVDKFLVGTLEKLSFGFALIAKSSSALCSSQQIVPYCMNIHLKSGDCWNWDTPEKSPSCLAWPFPPRQTELGWSGNILHPFHPCVVEAQCAKVVMYQGCIVIDSYTSDARTSARLNWSERRQDFLSLWTFASIISSQQ